MRIARADKRRIRPIAQQKAAFQILHVDQIRDVVNERAKQIPLVSKGFFSLFTVGDVFAGRDNRYRLVRLVSHHVRHQMHGKRASVFSDVDGFPDPAFHRGHLFERSVRPTLRRGEQNGVGSD